MTQEEKQLLLKDLFSRMLYGVKVHHYQGSDCILKSIDLRTYAAYVEVYDVMELKEFIEDGQRSIFEYKPYLRSLSSMTEEEKIEYDAEYAYNSKTYNYEEYLAKMIDWLLKHHFDFRNLIERGLAIEAPTDMYNTKTE